MQHIPPTGPLVRAARALATLLKRPGRVSQLAPVSLTSDPVMIDAAHIARYAALCGFARVDQVPMTYPQLLTFPLVMHYVTMPSFPWPAMGTVHLANAITQHRTLSVGEMVRAELHTGPLWSHDKGQVFTLALRILSEGSGDCVWEATQTLLRVGVRSPVGEPFAAGLDPEGPWTRSGEFDAPADIGRRYADVSGDHNPIHLWPITARLLGFRRAIAHGLWTQARAFALCCPEGGASHAGLHTVFKRPLWLPAQASVWQAQPSPTERWFEVRDALGQVPHLRAHFTQPPQTPQP